MKDIDRHKQHSGELFLHKKRQTPSGLIDAISHYISSDMPQQHADFFNHLAYLPIATVDEQGRPWVSILVTQSVSDSDIGMQVVYQNKLELIANIAPNDPFLTALQQQNSTNQIPLFAAVGIDFCNRRRNKIAGKIEQYDLIKEDKLKLQLGSNEHLGNCPKYITLRSLRPHTRQPKLTFNHPTLLNVPLSEECKAVLKQASTAFLATKHRPAPSNSTREYADMGLNHRGGMPGFIRIYEEIENEQTNTYLVLPDYSGNRFYQSLGNIHSSEVVGLALPDFTNGNVLYVTGIAENLFDNEAEELMPRCHLLTRIKLTGAVLIKHAIQLKLSSEERFSPYNPPVRYLKSELEQQGRQAFTSTQTSEIQASLIDIKPLSDNISTFTFELSEHIQLPLPGGFGIFDFSALLDHGYSHMDELNPQNLNDDYIRTWTLSSAGDIDRNHNRIKPSKRISITVRKKPRGLVSNYLHMQSKLTVAFKGSGNSFSCFSENTSFSVPKKMLWLAGGVGITPFMSMWDGILQLNDVTTDIILFFVGRNDDIAVLQHFLSNPIPKGVNLSIIGFQTNVDIKGKAALQSIVNLHSQSAVTVQQRRPKEADFRQIQHLQEREVYLCGPAALMEDAKQHISTNTDSPVTIHQESYFF